MNLIFILIASLLASGVTLWLGLALWRGPKLNSSIEHHAVNATVLRDQLAELEQDRANGILSLHDHAAAQQELQRRVLDEATPAQDTGQRRQSSKSAAIALAIVLPVAATLTYLAIGNPAAITPPPAQSAPAMTQADVQAMVDSLAARLARNPNDAPGWLMLARSYRYFEKYEDAAAAFAKAATVIQSDPLALSEFAETLARSNQAGFKGEPTQLLERALSLNPREPFALTLAGAAALERQDYPAAIDYWQQLFDLLPPDSDAARAVADSIERARRAQAETVTPKN
ncbi:MULTISPECIES: c-type cytochrome biogenesis protein CcmI [Pusillimonas]|uniref:C-type cytochrome biogenesis protein CcmI n=1 Tax=Pusillimonas minor TaxID=2697024 RepID=A0A842HTN8_9BURK|nr:MULTISPECIES: c-type cytochrome biogenesis protein CcmI [Pusillimonas]MBC2770992.1 c-type cytochrome biogenesis protein CcmI [Pusillimonas minor]ROT44281.1 c-type cytochrome biogenesis protein CcmI [Pusillimonas sp. NJUB218]